MSFSLGKPVILHCCYHSYKHAKAHTRVLVAAFLRVTSDPELNITTELGIILEFLPEPSSEPSFLVIPLLELGI